MSLSRTDRSVPPIVTGISSELKQALAVAAIALAVLAVLPPIILFAGKPSKQPRAEAAQAAESSVPGESLVPADRSTGTPSGSLIVAEAGPANAAGGKPSVLPQDEAAGKLEHAPKNQEPQANPSAPPSLVVPGPAAKPDVAIPGDAGQQPRIALVPAPEEIARNVLVVSQGGVPGFIVPFTLDTGSGLIPGDGGSGRITLIVPGNGSGTHIVLLTQNAGKFTTLIPHEGGKRHSTITEGGSANKQRLVIPQFGEKKVNLTMTETKVAKQSLTLPFDPAGKPKQTLPHDFFGKKGFTIPETTVARKTLTLTEQKFARESFTIPQQGTAKQSLTIPHQGGGKQGFTIPQQHAGKQSFTMAKEGGGQHFSMCKKSGQMTTALNQGGSGFTTQQTFGQQNFGRQNFFVPNFGGGRQNFFMTGGGCSCQHGSSMAMGRQSQVAFSGGGGMSRAKGGGR